MADMKKVYDDLIIVNLFVEDFSNFVFFSEYPDFILRDRNEKRLNHLHKYLPLREP